MATYILEFLLFYISVAHPPPATMADPVGWLGGAPNNFSDPFSILKIVFNKINHTAFVSLSIANAVFCPHSIKNLGPPLPGDFSIHACWSPEDKDAFSAISSRRKTWRAHGCMQLAERVVGVLASSWSPPWYKLLRCHLQATTMKLEIRSFLYLSLSVRSCLGPHSVHRIRKEKEAVVV